MDGWQLPDGATIDPYPDPIDTSAPKPADSGMSFTIAPGQTGATQGNGWTLPEGAKLDPFPEPIAPPVSSSTSGVPKEDPSFLANLVDRR